MKLAHHALRVIVGGLFVGHGLQKLFGWFDGPGLDGTTEMMEGLEMRPARANAIAAGSTEAIGGVMIATGTLTPVAAAGLIATMITAIRKVHFKNGPWNSDGGYELNLVIIASLLALTEADSGGCRGIRGVGAGGPRWMSAALLAGIAGSTAAIENGRRNSPDVDAPA